ncbi:hypothetical protein AB4427_14640 [Vibrio artabrorum]|uniref:hypothetical protein n=1 Tax=Vibrio artabrorum TaxID=446374 RepID=UPI003553C46B
MKLNTSKQWIAAHQLAVGMTIRCPLEGDEIMITDLGVISKESIRLGCEKGYASFDLDSEFELLKPFDLSAVNLNWIQEKIDEEERLFHWYSVVDLAWGTDDKFDKALIEIIPYARIGESKEPIADTESLLLTEDAFQSFFKALTDGEKTIDKLLTAGELQSDWGASMLTYLMSLQDFTSIIQPLLDPGEGRRINHWKRLGCQWVKIGFRQKFSPHCHVNS